MHFLFAAVLALTQQWLVVSDLHVDPFDRDPQPAYYESDTNWALFDAALARMRATAPNARVVVIAGDILAHEFGSKVREARPDQTTSAQALATMSRIERSFAAAFPHAQFLFAMGNNDDACGDYRTAPNTPYLAQVARIWEPLVNRNGASPKFLRDFSHMASYTARLPGPGLRAVVANSLFWSLFYKPCHRGPNGMAAAQMNWFVRTLHEARPGEHTIVVFHIPPGVDPTSTLLTRRFLVVPYWRDDMVVRFLKAVNDTTSCVAFVIAGHVHRGDFRLAGNVPILIAPAVSPIYLNNPAFLTLQIDAGGTLRDYQMYGYDLDSDTWSRIFDYTAAYGAKSFTAASVAGAHGRLGSDAGLRAQWIRWLLAGSRMHEIETGWRVFWCAQTQLRTGYAACAGDQRRVVLFPVFLALLALGLVAALAALWVRLSRKRSRS